MFFGEMDPTSSMLNPTCMTEKQSFVPCGDVKPRAVSGHLPGEVLHQRELWARAANHSVATAGGLCEKRWERSTRTL